jgi:hypothetical protein
MLLLFADETQELILLQLSQPQRECTAHLPPDERGATKQDRARLWGWLDRPLWTPFRTDAAHFLSRSQCLHFISLMASALTSSIIKNSEEPASFRSVSNRGEDNQDRSGIMAAAS